MARRENKNTPEVLEQPAGQLFRMKSGSFTRYEDGQRVTYEKGDTFVGDPVEIARIVGDMAELVADAPQLPAAAESADIDQTVDIVAADDGLFNVVQGGVTVNPEPLNETDAEELAKTLRN